MAVKYLRVVEKMYEHSDTGVRYVEGVTIEFKVGLG